MKPGKTKKIVSLLVIFGLVLTSGIFVPASSTYADSDRAVWGGGFDAQAALAKQDPYDPDKYYVWYNGKFYTGADPNEFDYGDADRAAGTITSDNGKINNYLDAYALVTKDQYIEFVAKNSADLASFTNGLANAVWIDLQGATVVPAMMDAHAHIVSTGTLANQIPIFWKSKTAILAEVEKEARRLQALGANPNSQWIVSRGWLQTLGGDWNVPHPDSVANWPTRWELDSVTRALGPEFDFPVRLGHASGHGMWANTKAFELRASYDPDHPPTTPIVGGEIIINSKGQAIGVLTDTAAFSAPSASAAENRAGIFAAERQAFSYGITGLMDAGSSQSNFQQYDQAQNGMLQDFEGQYLKLRIYQLLSNSASAISTFKNSIGTRGDEYGRLIGGNDNRLTVRAIKWVSDGALGVRTAGMIDPYYDTGSPGDVGIRFTYEQYLEINNRNLRANWQTSAHAIGDLANRRFLDSFLEVRDAILAEADAAEADGNLAQAEDLRVLVKDPRPKPEHYQLVNIDKLVDGKTDIERSVEAGFVVSMQFVHATSDMPAAEDRIGPDRIRGGYAWRTVLDLGGVIANGTDTAVELMNPYHGLYAAVTRVGRFGNIGRTSPEGSAIDAVKFVNKFEPGTKNFTEDSGWYADQRLTRAEALHYYTWGVAYGQFEENIKGTLDVGKLADFVVVDRPYFDRNACWDWEIKEMNAVMTVCGGEIVYTMGAAKVTSESLADGVKGEDYSSPLTASGTENFVWSIVKADPRLNWVKIDEYRGTLSGVPTVPGTYEITVKAENYVGSDTRTLTITVEGEMGFVYNNAKFVSMTETAKNSRVWVLTFTVDKVYDNWDKESKTFSINLNGNNANLDGRYTFGGAHELAGYSLVYDVKGNGSNIKDFRLVIN